jgi:hypothetical protein
MSLEKEFKHFSYSNLMNSKHHVEQVNGKGKQKRKGLRENLKGKERI